MKRKTDNLFEEINAKVSCADVIRQLGSEHIVDEDSETIYVKPLHRESISGRSIHVSKTRNAWLDRGDRQMKGGPVQLAEYLLFQSVSPSGRWTRPGTAWQATDRCLELAGLPESMKWGKTEEELAEIAHFQQLKEETENISTELIEHFHTCLINQPDKLEVIKSQYGFTDETIKKWKIGFGQTKEWIDGEGNIQPDLSKWMSKKDTNVLMRTGLFLKTDKLPCDFVLKSGDDTTFVNLFFKDRFVFPYFERDKVRYSISRKSPYSPTTEQRKYTKQLTHGDKHPDVFISVKNDLLWNEEILNDPKTKQVIITEGITDALMADQLGFTVISPVTVNLKKDDFTRVIPKLKGKDIFIIQDVEISGVGRKGAETTAKYLEENGITVKIVDLPLDESQITARSSLQTEFGISADTPKTEQDRIKKSLTPENLEKVKQLESAAKMDLNLFGQQDNAAEKIQALLDSAETRLERIINSRIPRLKEKDETILNDKDFLYAMADAAKLDPALHFKALKAAVGMKRPLERAIKDLEPVREKKDKPEILISHCLSQTSFPNLAEAHNLLMPENMAITDAGTAFVGLNGQGELEYHTIANVPIVPTKISRDVISGQEHILLKWVENGRWRKISVAREKVANHHKIVDETAGYGFPANSRNAKMLSNYICDCLSANSGRLPIEQESHSLGWLPGGQFLYGSELISKGETSNIIAFTGDDQGNRDVLNSLTVAGTLEGWIDGIRPLRPYPRAIATIGAAFAAPCIKIFKIDNYTHDVSGTTSRGKTITCLIAISVFADPSTDCATGLIGPWNCTIVSAERRLSMLNGFPVYFDDSQETNREILDQIIYMIANGRPKGRGTQKGLGYSVKFKTTALSSGEAPLNRLSGYNRGGKDVRLINLHGNIYGEVSEETLELVKTVSENTRLNHGHAGRKFIKFLLDNEDRWPEFQERHKQRTNSYIFKVSGEFSRVAASCAATSIAIELAQEAGCLPADWEDPFIYLLPEIEASLAQKDAATNALFDVYEWAVRNSSGFIGQDDYEQKKGILFGEWRDPWTHINILPKLCEKILIENKYEPESILCEWNERGWLDATKTRKHQRQMRCDRKTLWFVSIRKQAFIEAGILPSDKNVRPIRYQKDDKGLTGLQKHVAQLETDLGF